MERLLPRLQLTLVALFFAISFFGPLIFAQALWVILASVLVGLLFGGVTLLIGWRWFKDSGPVDYPFGGWSAGILKPFLRPREFQALSVSGQVHSPAARRVLGIASLAIGALMIVAMVGIAIFVLMG